MQKGHRAPFRFFSFFLFNFSFPSLCHFRKGGDDAMPATINKQRLIGQLFTALKKQYDPPHAAARPVLEEAVYALLREGATGEEADRAFDALRKDFFDWNEVRVSSQ